MMIDINAMAAFERVVREGSYTAAARALGVAKSTLSDRVARLEERLGVRLLNRTTRRVRPTGIGARYYERCAHIVAQAEEADQLAQALQARPVGTLRMSAPNLFGRAFLGPVLTEYMNTWPDVRVELVLTDRWVHLVEEGFDLSVVIGELEDSSLTVRRLGPAVTYCVASPAHAEMFGLPPEPARLETARCIATRVPARWDFGVNERITIEPWLVVNSHEVALQAALAGVGIARLPPFMVEGHVASGALIPVFGARPAGWRTIYALYPTRRYLPPKTRLFLDLLTSRIEPLQPWEDVP